MTIRLEIADRVARVMIDRPEVLNALDAEGEEALEAVWQQLEANRDVHAVVLTGAGERAFCVGADLKAGGRSGLEYWAITGMSSVVRNANLVIAAAEASFGLPEPRVGLLPLDGGMVLLQRQVPFRQAMGVLLTGRRFSAAEALAMGLVNEVVPRAELDTAVERWVGEILACAPLSLRAIKQAVRRTAHLAAAEARAQRLSALIECLQSADAEEGVRAFREKRPPVWTGR